MTIADHQASAALVKYHNQSMERVREEADSGSIDPV